MTNWLILDVNELIDFIFYPIFLVSPDDLAWDWIGYYITSDASSFEKLYSILTGGYFSVFEVERSDFYDFYYPFELTDKLLLVGAKSLKSTLATDESIGFVAEIQLYRIWNTSLNHTHLVLLNLIHKWSSFLL